jgi:phage-related baseplate assembly protein
VPGPGGNTPAHTVVEVVDGLGFPATVTNPAPFLSGLAEETPEARRERFRLYIGGLSRGTKIALEFAARSVVLTDAENNVLERVAAVLVREPYQDDPNGLLGRVEVYVDNGSGTPSPELLQKVDDVLRGTVTLEGVIVPGWIAAGVDLNVYGVTAVPVAVTGTITVGIGFNQAATATEVANQIAAYLGSLPVFAEARTAEIVAAAMGVDGVVDFVLADPVANVHVTFSQSVEPGIITILTVSA